MTHLRFDRLRWALFALTLVLPLGASLPRTSRISCSSSPTTRPTSRSTRSVTKRFRHRTWMPWFGLERPLTHTYNMGGYHGAVCVASRTMLVSGRYLWHAQRLEQTIKQPQEIKKLWPQLLKQQGYDTYFTGKWHIKADANKVFDTATHIRGGMPKQTPAGYNRPHEGQPDEWSPSDPKFGGFWEGGKHWSEVVKDDAVSYLERASQRDNPFFMYIAFNAPHDPRQSPQEYVDRYPLAKIKTPANFLADYPFKDQIGCGPGLRDEKLAPFPRTEYAVKVNRQEYYAIITHMDHQIGLILEALEKSGKRDNTYIFFTADHGLSCGHHGLLGKQNMYDHSVRVPMVVNGKGIEAGKKIDTSVYLQDIMPTTLELAGASIPDPCSVSKSVARVVRAAY